MVDRWRNVLLNGLIFTTSLLLCLIALEGVLRLLPIAAAPPFHPPTESDPVPRYAAGKDFTWSQGWALSFPVKGRTNAQGFVADHDYTRDGSPLLALVGDSYVEAMQVPFRDSIAGRLHASLGERGRVYPFAQSGAPLSQYVAYARHACSAYRPERLVVVVVGNDFDESLYEHRLRGGLFHLHRQPDGRLTLALTPPAPSRLEGIARKSALAVYLVRNLKVIEIARRFRIGQAFANEGAFVGNTAAVAGRERVAEGEAVSEWFLNALPAAACLAPQHIAIVVDAARSHLYDRGAREAANRSYFGVMRANLIARARALGFKVVDLEPAFLAAFARDRKPFEFPEDGHWNSHGHAVAARAVEDALQDWPPFSSQTAGPR